MNVTTQSTDGRLNANPTISYRARILAAEGASNPLLEAARPLLDALAKMPTELDANGVAEHRHALMQQLRTFGRICGELKLPAEHVDKARYCLCSALDEAAGQTDWGDGSRPGMDWSATALASSFGYDRQGGDRVYAIAAEAMHEPDENHCLIEVIQQILERGFRGRYRFASDREQKIATVREQIEQTVAADTPQHTASAKCAAATLDSVSVPTPVAVETQPVSTTLPKSRPWLQAVALGVLLIAVAAAIGYWHVTAPRQTTLAISNSAPPNALSAELTRSLSSEINTGAIGIAEDTQHAALTLQLEGIFDAGGTSVRPQAKPMIFSIGQQIAQTSRRVIVTGYTDNRPFARTSPGSQYGSNQALSDARALEVAQLLVAAGVAAERITSRGKGDTEAAADNATPQGRTRNRRVEITVTE
jgi:type VI secretion system protein ImpK